MEDDNDKIKMTVVLKLLCRPLPQTRATRFDLPCGHCTEKSTVNTINYFLQLDCLQLSPSGGLPFVFLGERKLKET